MHDANGNLTSAAGLQPGDLLRFLLDDPYGQAKAGDVVTVREVRNGYILLKESRVDGYHHNKFAWVRRPTQAQPDAIAAFRRILTDHRIERGSGAVEMLRPADIEALTEKLAAAVATVPVEASGSEREDCTTREWADRCIAKRVAGDLFAKADRTANKDPMRSETVAGLREDGEALMRLAARPQPREAVARLVDPSAWRRKDEGHPGGENFVKKSLRLADRILALVRPAPGASGGQQSSPDEGLAKAVERLKADAEYFDHPEEGAETHCRALCWVAKDIRTVLAAHTYTCTSGRGENCTCYACHGG